MVLAGQENSLIILRSKERYIQITIQNVSFIMLSAFERKQ